MGIKLYLALTHSDSHRTHSFWDTPNKYTVLCLLQLWYNLNKAMQQRKHYKLWLNDIKLSGKIVLRGKNNRGKQFMNITVIYSHFQYFSQRGSADQGVPDALALIYYWLRVLHRAWQWDNSGIRTRSSLVKSDGTTLCCRMCIHFLC